MYFPVAFQILFLVLLAALGWGANLRLLSRAGIEVRPVLQLAQLPTSTHRDDGAPDDGLCRGVFRLVRTIGAVAAAGWLLSAMVSATPGMQTFFALLAYVAVVGIMVLPQRVFCHAVRMQFLGSLARIVSPSMSSPVFLCDIVLADILTSCARTFADMRLVACQFVSLVWPASAGREADSCTHTGVVGALLVATPYAFRLRQCVNEYLQAPPASAEARRHLANAAKYASAFPVICLSLMHRRIEIAAAEAAKAGSSLDVKHPDWTARVVFGLWIIAVALNSLYSYYWDVAFDWNLGHTNSGWKLADLVVPPLPISAATTNGPLEGAGEEAEAPSAREFLSPGDALASDMYAPSSKRSFPRLLRPRMCFTWPWLYYAAMAIDFLLRITWTAKLSSYIRIDQMAFGGFWLNVLEVYRRWQWTFLRIEKEAAAAL
ncbi:protein-ER retention protein [Coemansia thaxteri]|uniref:Protein-ER retention protein n=1 Tax=Coemansia thaxteri TaxID=2663907 RepID=A0A9W8EGM2_9FUNG|nr:protein-ER retention protein [Coemansia thaxteri]KAJ2486470.1 protein-ER retention protein [Coemansia sp. RSA 2320]